LLHDSFLVDDHPD